MKIQDLKTSFHYGMHGCGSYKGTNHVNSLEAMRYWMQKGVEIFEIDMARTSDDKYVALAHTMNAHCLKAVEINPYRDKSMDKYSEAWFMRNKLCERTTGGLSPMNLDVIVNEMAEHPEIIVMFDLWGLWDSDSTYSFSEQLLEKASGDIKERCLLEVYNKEMLSGIKNASPELHTMYCVHGTSADEFDGNVSPSILKDLGVNIISFPWVCTKDFPGEMEKYHESGFTIFSLSHDNRDIKKMQKAGVNVNLVDVLYTPNFYGKALWNKISTKISNAFHNKQEEPKEEMTVDEVHDVALEMMKEVHEFCVANDIQYSLAYGSLLGAIRHKGFIPWDDDIDIWMTRPNFEKFTRTFKSKKGYRHLSIYDKDSLLCFDRIIEIDHTYVKNMAKACEGKTGVWIDIMPLDVVPNEDILRSEQYNGFAAFNKNIDIYRGWQTNLETRKKILIFKVFIKKILSGESLYLRKNVIKNIHQKQIAICKKYSNIVSSNYCFFQCGVLYRNEPQELLPQKSISNYRLTPFVDTELMIVEDYDHLLTLLYGDYMTPPPVEKQQKSHGKCLWK